MVGAPHVAALQLRRFRSHIEFASEFDRRPVAIHGPNGAGKTNILEALSQLSPGRGLRGASAEEIAGRPDPIGWFVGAELASDGESRSITVSVDLRDSAGRRKIMVDGEPSGQTGLGGLLRTLWLTPAMDRLWIEGASERRRFVDRLALLFEPTHAAAAAAYERALRERNRLFKEQRRDPSWFAAIEARMAESGAAVEAARARAIAEILTSQTGGAFPEAALQLESADESAPAGPETAEALALRYAAGRPREAMAGRSLIGPHRTDLAALYLAKNMPAKSCSTGEQKALLVSIVLAAARATARLYGAAPILLLDEVAAHLDASRRAALFDAVVELGAQAWMTAAGGEFFDELGGRAQYIALNPD
ncbi:MAG: DNA replication/repair protein RecF [Neomegalonema sp.]|nr:DNA replication/repair protein RecF [Neomegalonema sp.]